MASKMNQLNSVFKLLLMLAVFVACNSKIDTTKHMNEQEKTPNQQKLTNDTLPKVTGVGGIFFFSDDPEKTKAWYTENLGLETNEWGASFEFRNAQRPDEINYLQWSPFSNGSDYFAPSKKEFMINYRVQNIEGLVEKLKTNKVTILDEIESFEYGKFVHIMDADGNKIELWEPVDSVFTEMGEKTTK